MPLSAISYAGHLVTAIVGANDGDDRSNACVMLSHELESLLELQFRGKSVDRAEDWRRLVKKVRQRIKCKDAQERRVQQSQYAQRPQKLVVPSGQDPVSMFDPATWGMAFPELFPFSDGVPLLVRETKMSFLETIQYLLMRDELVYDVPGMDEYQASDRARWSSHVSRRVFGCRWNSAARCLAGGCARCRCGLYWARKKCKTKVDEETGCCKKQSTHGCATEQEDSRTILATVHLADWTGNLLVNEAALCELTAFKTAELLLTEVDRHGTAALCFGIAAMSVSRRATSTSSGPAARLPSLRLPRNCHSVHRRHRPQKWRRLKNVSLKWCMQSLRWLRTSMKVTAPACQRSCGYRRVF